LPATEPSPAEGFWIEARGVVVEDWGDAGRVQVAGASNLPDGAHVSASLAFAGYRVASAFEPAECRDGVWVGTALLPPGSRFYSGVHECVAAFDLVVEDPGQVEQWIAVLSPAEADALRSVESRREIFVGLGDEALAEDRDERAYYEEALVAARRFHDGLVSRVDELQHAGKGWSPELLHGVSEARAAWFRESFVDEEGLLAEPRWRRFLDEEWRPALQARVELHATRSSRKYLGPYSRLETLLSSTLQMSRVYSMFVVYPMFELEPHANDFYFDERGKNDLLLLRQLVDEQFTLLDQFVRSLPAPAE